MENTIFPGRDGYTGPNSGILGLCHHNRLFEPSHNFAERVNVIKTTKPKNEIATRLHNLIYIDLAVVPGITAEANAHWQETEARWKEADARWQEVGLKEDYARLKEAKARWQEADAHWRKAEAIITPQILAYIRAQIPDCAWNGTELVFPTA